MQLNRWIVTGHVIAALVVGAAVLRAQSLATRLPAPEFETGKITSDLVLADVNGDGRTDAIAVNITPDASVLLGDGKGGFLLPAIKSTLDTINPTTSRWGAVGDMDGDGHLDLVSTFQNGGKLAILPGNGLGDFGPPTFVAGIGSAPQRFGLADVDHDGDLDVAAMTLLAAGGIVIYGDGDGGITGTQSLPFQGVPTDLLVADLDGDGNADIVETTTGSSVNVRWGTGVAGPGVFELGQSVAAGTTQIDGELADMDGDGLLDIVIASMSTPHVAVLLNEGGRKFAGPSLVSTGLVVKPFTLSVADFDGDGAQDVLTSTVDNDTSVLLGDGAGGLGGPHLGRLPVAVSFEIGVADLDGDAMADIVSSRTSSSLLQGLVVQRAVGGGEHVQTVIFTVAGGPSHAIAAGDLNADGRPDLVKTHLGTSPTVTVNLGEPGGGFIAPTSFPAIVQPRAVALGHLDAGSSLDAVVLNPDTGALAPLPGNGTGGFGAGTFMTSSADRPALAIADLTGDGLDEVLLIHAAGNAVSVLKNQSGVLQPPVDYTVPGSGPADLAVGDVNGDTLPDVVTANDAGGSVSVLLGDGNGALLGAGSITIGPGARQVALGDFDGDGHLDAAVARGTPGATVVMLKGSGAGTWTVTGTTGTSLPASELAAADVDGDGHLDVVASSSDGWVVFVLAGTGLGTLAPPVKFATDGPTGFALADVNEDGRVDVAVNSLSKIQILANDGPLHEPWTNLLASLAGVHGAPLLSGFGTLLPATPVTLDLVNAAKSSTAWLVLGASMLSAPFKGGVLLPAPQVVLPLPTSPGGDLVLPATWPAGIPSGFEIFFQYWVQDGAGPAGFTASNSVVAHTP